MAPETARLLARELGRDQTWQTEQVEAFLSVAEGYIVT
jgi:glycerol-3-phosphate dehydrogenase